jgi:hypothetical protein
MATWTTFTAMIGNTEIRLDLLEQHAATAGWIVRRSCNVWQAFRAPLILGDCVDLETDGELVGIFSDDETARQAVVDAVGIDEPQILRAVTS